MPTLRNVALTAPYMHNGVFATLEEVMDMYNSNKTDLKNNAEVPENISGDVGDLFLTNEDKQALVAFLKTLTDKIPTPVARVRPLSKGKSQAEVWPLLTPR